MMELAAASVAANALRVGLNIVTGGRRPLIEFYWQVFNQYAPPRKIPARQIANGFIEVPESELRWQETGVSIFAVNIGGNRAENVVFRVESGTRHDGRIPWGAIFDNPIRQMAPGQSVYLLRLSSFDLHKAKDLILSVNYQAPRSLLTWPAQLWSSLRKRSQYRCEFNFHLSNISTDLPPPNYA